MTEPVAFVRPKTTRTLAALAAAGLLGVLAPVSLAAPASAAAESAGCPEGFGATAASNTLAIGGIDLRPLGVDEPPLPEVRAATAHAGFAGGPSRAAADARYLQSSGVLPAGVLGPAAYQQAPPPHEQPATVPVKAVDLGALSLGTGNLSAHATLDASKCTAAAGPTATSEAKLAGLTVLPSRGDRALLRFGGLQSATVTKVDALNGKVAASAAATGSVADFTLLSGSVGVHVVSAPSLKVASGGGKKSVDYKPPVLQVAVPGRDAVRLDSAGSYSDIVVPVDGRNRTEAEAIAKDENLPIAGLGLLDLLTGTTTGLSGTVEGAKAVPESLLASLGLPGLPAVGGGESTVRTPEGSRQHPAKAVVLRVELGALDQQQSATGVYAKAFSIRIKLIARTNPHRSSDGYGGTAATKTDQVTVVDLGICSLEAAAAAPRSGGYGGHGTGPDYGGVSGGGDTLPVTGPRAAIVGGAGLLLLVAGRMFLVLSRRRSAS